MGLLISRIALTIILGYFLIIVWTKNVNIGIWIQNKTKSILPINKEIESQSARETAIRSAAAELEQIANNFEIWAEKQHNKFSKGFSQSDSDKWMGNWLADSFVTTLFSYPVAKQANGGFPRGSKKEFRLIIDTFRLYMPSIADSLSDTYNSFLKNIKFHVQHYELEKQNEKPLLLFWCSNFLDTAVTPTVRRLRHIAKIAKENLDAGETEEKDEQ